MELSNNLLLYGPPGTGKTYNTVNYAVSIIENRPFEEIVKEGYALALEKYSKYTLMGRIAFMTFHQSLSYDDFIEGIRPDITEDGSLVYVPMPGAFYRFCRDADHPRLIDGAVPDIFVTVSDDSHIYTVSIPEAENQQDFEMSVIDPQPLPEGTSAGDVLVSMVSPTESDMIGVVMSTNPDRCVVRWHKFSAVQKVKGAQKGREMPYRIYMPTKKFVYTLVHEGGSGDMGNCVFIIDEINRGNISRIFGELITLLESSRRKGNPECLEVYLAQMKTMFSVPDNVYVLGTMNTADKSLTALDAALRRRFEFIEMMPDPMVLNNREVSGVNLSKLLAVINNRIEILYDREHMIGHAYFISVKSIDDLAQCFINKVIPLLQEYFFDDYEKICWVLGRHDDPRKCDFIVMRPRTSFQMKFNLPNIFDIVKDYRVFLNPESYILMYKGEL